MFGFFFPSAAAAALFFLILLLQEKLLLTQKRFCLTQLHKAVYPVVVYGSGFGPLLAVASPQHPL